MTAPHDPPVQAAQHDPRVQRVQHDEPGQPVPADDGPDRPVPSSGQDQAVEADRAAQPDQPARPDQPDEPDRHPVNHLDDVVHQRVRLGVLTVAHQARRVEFGFLRTTLGLTAGNLSQHLSVLEKAALIAVEKGYEGRRPRTWITLTAAGEQALRDEVTHLKRLIRQIEDPGASM